MAFNFLVVFLSSGVAAAAAAAAAAASNGVGSHHPTAQKTVIRDARRHGKGLLRPLPFLPLLVASHMGSKRRAGQPPASCGNNEGLDYQQGGGSILTGQPLLPALQLELGAVSSLRGGVKGPRKSLKAGLRSRKGKRRRGGKGGNDDSEGSTAVAHTTCCLGKRSVQGIGAHGSENSSKVDLEALLQTVSGAEADDPFQDLSALGDF
ncbi:unnamed protein product, partial [Pylaiella littoralis]